MNWMKRKTQEGSVVKLPIAHVRRNPHQPRAVFEESALRALADSIRRYGILQPISVRKTEEGYELIAGERRLRAALLAGEREIPCIVYAVDGETSAELAVMENLLREDLNIFETAAAMDSLSREYGMTQEQIAERLSVSQSYVANKLRLLRFGDEMQQKILAAGLTERHARALLRLPEDLWESTLADIIARNLNVAAAERLVEEILSGQPSKRNKGKKPPMRGAMRDIRLFYNSIDRALALVRRCGVKAVSHKEEEENEIRLVISIPKHTQETALRGKE